MRTCFLLLLLSAAACNERKETGKPPGPPADSGESGDSATTPDVPPVPGEYAFDLVWDFGFNVRPVDLEVLPDDRLLVGGLTGGLYLYDPAADAMLGPTTIGNEWPADMVSFVVHPSFGDGANDYLYCWLNMSTQLLRYHLSLDPFEATDPVLLFEATKELTDGHSGGELLWWSGETLEPVLYLTIGDGQLTSGQDTSTVFGAVVAFAVDNETGTVAPGVPVPGFENPFVVAAGVRNPWRMIDCGDRICLADVGRDSWEEVDLYSAAGDNFGWPDREGPVAGVVSGKGHGNYIDPYFTYNHHDVAYHDRDDDNYTTLGHMKAIWAGMMASEKPFDGELEGHLIVGEHYDGWVGALYVGEPLPLPEPVPIGHQRYLSEAAETSTGEIYATDLSGTLRHMVRRADMARLADPGAALSDSSYAAGGIAYAPRYEFHNNGTTLGRFVQVPAGETVGTSDPVDWVWPVGTKAYQTLGLDGDPIEVRALEKTDDGWIAGVYVYDGEDAFLTDGRIATVATPAGDYPIPSVSGCEECHGATRGRDWIVGIEPFMLGDAGLASFASVLDTPPGPAPVVDGDDVTAFARGYLHANCWFCHNGEGKTRDLVNVQLDLRWDTPVDQMHAIGEPVLYHADLSAINVILPGYPDSSAMLMMMEGMRMPPSDLWAPDTAAIEEIGEWIAAMGG